MYNVHVYKFAFIRLQYTSYRTTKVNLYQYSKECI